MKFEWDQRKEASNTVKHGVGFAEAVSVFGDPLSRTISDHGHSIEEDRFIIIGLLSKRNLLGVVHTVREDRVRLISARPATKNEKRDYQESIH